MTDGWGASADLVSLLRPWLWLENRKPGHKVKPNKCKVKTQRLKIIQKKIPSQNIKNNLEKGFASAKC